MRSKDLLTDLKARTLQLIVDVQPFKELPNKVLNYQPSTGRWSALQCLEHLNRYGDFYLPELEQRFNKSRYPASTTFNSNWLGNYFAKAVGPQEPLNTMKTFKSMNPSASEVNRQVIDTFLQQQERMLRLLDHAKAINLTKTKTSITIAKWIRLRAGDTFRVVIYHNQRHIIQALSTLQSYSTQEKVI